MALRFMFLSLDFLIIPFQYMHATSMDVIELSSSQP